MPDHFSAEAEGSNGCHAATLAPLAIRRKNEIYAINGGWFQARWHFSFDQYYDPQNMGVGKLRVFNHDTLAPGAIWPMHPHRDVEGITYVVAGHFEHADSIGNDGVLEPGGIQRMTLGSGALHSERNHSRTEPMQFIQMWILPSRRGLLPSVEQHQFTVQDRQNHLLQVVRPERTEGVGVTVHQQASVSVARLDPSAQVEQVVAGDHCGYFYLLEGALDLNHELLATGDAARVAGGGLLHIRALEPSELVLVDVPI
ncbi:MAG: pirin family protein [Chloroflexi bacterium]|nr:pirin family protein [Chloroflexota bacterium]